MNGFDFYSVPRIVFGRGKARQLGEIAGSFGAEVLLVQNIGPAGGGGVVDRILGLLHSAGVRCRIHLQQGEPKVDDVDRALDLARGGKPCELIVGLGGGSDIDVAKATAGLLGNGGSALDYMEVVGKGQKITRPALPWIAVPTTAGTGAEATRNAVIGYPPRKFKASIRSELLLPRIALVDPELTVDVPPAVTAASGMDALCQCIEAYTSNAAQPITDALALQGVKLAGRSLRRAFIDGQDLGAREDLSMAALLSGIALTNVGLGAVHGFEAPMGASFPIPHGAVCAALLPPVMAANVKALRAAAADHPVLDRYAEIGRTLTAERQATRDQAIAAGIDFVHALTRDLRIPGLSHWSFAKTDIPPMVQLAKQSSSMRYNPIALSDEALAEILRTAL